MNLISNVQSSANICYLPYTFLSENGFSLQFNISDGDVLICSVLLKVSLRMNRIIAKALKLKKIQHVMEAPTKPYRQRLHGDSDDANEEVGEEDCILPLAFIKLEKYFYTHILTRFS